MDQRDKNRYGRIETLKNLLATHLMSTQEEVLRALRSCGYDVTQATLSRDMKALKVAKIRTKNGAIAYAIPENASYKIASSRMPTDTIPQSSGYLSLRFAGNLAVMKTQKGWASVIAGSIDDADMPSVVGTIAGVDTVFIALIDSYIMSEVVNELSAVVPELQQDPLFDID